MAVRHVDNAAADLRVGDEQEPLAFTVTPELNEQYVYAVEDYRPCYLRPGPWGAPLVHPALLLNMTSRTRSPSFTLPPGWSSIHARDETEFLKPARVGEALTVRWTVVDVYERKGRPYQAVECLVVDADGARVLRRVAHSTVSRPEKAVTGKG
jgi:acyl dehydratase